MMNMKNITEIADATIEFTKEFGLSVPELKELREIAVGVTIGLEDVLGDRELSKSTKIKRSVNLIDEIEKVTFSDPATIVFWKDGTKTVTKCCEGDTYNKETGLAMCIVRKLCNNRHYNDVFEKFCK